ncbi:MAG TPA: polysaccharide biosynthesis/export family protein [Bacteroidales bacterium]|nr:polysaccharide biosynthesis/export family protein [Bacteroidales bacterium]
MKRYIWYLLVFILFASGCKVFMPHQMLRQGDYPVSVFPDSLRKQEYRIAPNDILEIRILTNNGEKMVDPVSGDKLGSQLTYLVEYDGQIKLPILNRIPIVNKSISEAEKMLEEKFSVYFNNPFVQIKVTNSRVTIFPGGEGSDPMVVVLDNTNTTLFEALAKIGGIKDGKAHKIKLIRGDLRKPEVYLIDLSTVRGMTEADLVLQANDIIYVEPRVKAPQKLLEALAPFTSLLTSLLMIYQVFVKK